MDSEEVGRIIVIRHKGRIYDHYGIQDGNSNIIHVNKKKGMITCDPLIKALRNAISVTYIPDEYEVRYNNYMRAKELVGSKHTYKLFTSNCETFIREIRSGNAFSKQVDQISNTTALAILGIVSIFSISKSLSGE